MLGLKQSAFLIVSECINPFCLDLKTEDGAITDKTPAHLEVLLNLFSFFLQLFIKNKNVKNELE